MSETKYTPAPWSRDAIYWALRYARNNYCGWADECKAGENMITEDDATLMSKAPELLVALEMMVTFNCRKCNLLNHAVSCGTCFILEHKQLIAEAKGEKQ